MHFRQFFIGRFAGTMFLSLKTVFLFSLFFFIPILVPPSFAEGDSFDLLAAKGASLSPVGHSGQEARLILLMNQTRVKAGLGHLKPSRILGEVARTHSRDMGARNFFLKAGLGHLKPSRILGEVARTHSRDMGARNFFSHNSPNGRGPKERLERAGFAWRAFGENIGCGQDTAEEILLTWMDSSAHRENILDPAYTEVGVGLIRGGECHIYWTALFARPRGR
jgi:uncharacterized protein YkwD